MTKDETDFDTWYEFIKQEVDDRVAEEVPGPEDFRQQYADGDNAYDIVDEICSEYEYDEYAEDDDDADADD